MKMLTCRRPCAIVDGVLRAQGKIWLNTSSISIYWQPFCCLLDVCAVINAPAAAGVRRAMRQASVLNAELLLSSRYHFLVGFLGKVWRSLAVISADDSRLTDCREDEQRVVFVASHVWEVEEFQVCCEKERDHGKFKNFWQEGNR